MNETYYEFCLRDNIIIMISNKLLANFVTDRAIYRKKIEAVIIFTNTNIKVQYN